MLPKAISQQLDRLLSLQQQGVFTDQEFGYRLASLVTAENAADILGRLPPHAVESLKDGVTIAAQ